MKCRNNIDCYEFSPWDSTSKSLKDVWLWKKIQDAYAINYLANREVYKIDNLR